MLTITALLGLSLVGFVAVWVRAIPAGHKPPGGLFAILRGGPRLSLPLKQIVAREQPRRVCYINAHWFVDTSFVAGTRVVVDGVFQVDSTAAVDTVIDLGGRWVIPPLAEAHTHHLSDGAPVAEQSAQYLGAGVQYIKVLNNTRRLTAAIRAQVNHAGTVDVAYANGGITGPGGHPTQVYKALVKARVLDDMTERDLPNEAYFIVRDERELERVWSLVLEGKPDFIKLYLSSSEHHGRAGWRGDRGLDPRLVRPIVERAHTAGLRVSAHVRTRSDFRVAVEGGVDEIAHLPLEALTPDAAAIAAASGTVIVTTTVSHLAGVQTRLAELHAINLGLLKRAGARIAFGTDNFELTVRDEVRHLRQLGVFSDAELLRLWTYETARTIFPLRIIGALEPGFEASFLVLDENPLVTFSATERIWKQVKRGVLIETK